MMFLLMNFHKRKKIISALHSLSVGAQNSGLFDTELVSKIIAELKRGSAADIDGLTAEHSTLFFRLYCRNYFA